MSCVDRHVDEEPFAYRTCRTDCRPPAHDLPPPTVRYTTEALSITVKEAKEVKEVDLYSAFTVVPHTQGAQVRITQCYLQIIPYLPLPRKHSPDGASPD